MPEPLSAEDRLYMQYLKVVEGFAWFRTYYPGDAYANETFENLEAARKHWDKTLIAEPIHEPAASGKRDGFAYVRVTYRHRNDILADEQVIKKRVLAAVQAKQRSVAFAAALRKIVQAEGTFKGTQDKEDQVLWACLTATVPEYLEAAIHAMDAEA
jgi:hypothetical protein